MRSGWLRACGRLDERVVEAQRGELVVRLALRFGLFPTGARSFVRHAARYNPRRRLPGPAPEATGFLPEAILT
jgi:hypothetical protein